MWEISASLQISSFLYSIVLGIIFALVYEIFRVIRKLKKHSTISVFVQDILYFAVISVVTFLFFLSRTNGEIRLFIIIGISLGYLFYFLLVSRYVNSVFNLILKLIFNGFSLINKAFYLIMDKIALIFTVFLKNTLKCYKKVLKIANGMLYTNRN